MLSTVQIIQIVLVPICLPLETDAGIGGLGMEDKPPEPFEQIGDIESYPEQFTSLRRVYGFVTEAALPLLLAAPLPLVPAGDDQSEEVDRQEAAEGYDVRGQHGLFTKTKNPILPIIDLDFYFLIIFVYTYPSNILEFPIGGVIERGRIETVFTFYTHMRYCKERRDSGIEKSFKVRFSDSGKSGEFR